MILNILLVSFIVIVSIQIIYYLFIFGSFSFGKIALGNASSAPVSIIVLIDDASNDETLELFEEYEKQYSNVKLVKVQNNETFWGNKKYALTLGIKVAKYKQLLFIDADCKPASSEWISNMSRNFTHKKTIILGYGAYNKTKNSGKTFDWKLKTFK